MAQSCTPCTVVYASPQPSPADVQHSLLGGRSPYPGGTFTRWNTPAFPGAPVFPSRPYRSTDTAHSGGQGWPKAIAKDAALTAASTGPLWPRRPSQTLRKKGLIKTNTLTSRLHERIRPVCSSQRPLITAMWHMEAPRASLLTPRRASAIFDQPLRLTGLPSEGSSWLLFKGGTYARGIYTDGELEEGAGRSRRVRCQLSLWPADIAWNVGAGRHTTDPACARRYGSDGRDHANQAFERGATCPLRAGEQAAFGSRFRTLAPVVIKRFDLRAVLAASVGSDWTSVPPDQQDRLLQAFRRYTVASYVANFARYDGQSFTISPDTRSSIENGWSYRAVRASRDTGDHRCCVGPAQPSE